MSCLAKLTISVEMVQISPPPLAIYTVDLRGEIIFVLAPKYSKED